jgi:transposase-like protein
MATKIQASAEKNKLFEALLNDEGEGSPFKNFIKRGVEKIIQETLELQVTEFLGRDYYAHRESDAPHKGYRNGYYDRSVLSTEGRMNIRVPRVRDTEEDFESNIVRRLAELEENLKELAREMYVRGASTRDIEQAFIDKETGKPLLSKSSVSELNKSLWDEYERFSTRDLSHLDVVYLFIDGVYEAVKKYSKNQTILACWGICADGHKEIITLVAVASESTDAWISVFEDLVKRGLRQPLLVVSDGGKGVPEAVKQVFPKAKRQRCLAHKVRNIQVKLPEDKCEEVMTRIKSVYHADDRATADILAARVIEEYAAIYPAAIKCFSDDLEACLAHLEFPLGHRKFIRTTNLLERAFEEEKRRTKVIPQHVNERGALSLIFAVLYRASERWQNVRMSTVELAQLRKIRSLMHNINTDDEFISYRLAA